MRADSASSVTNVATIIRAHNVQQKSVNQPPPPLSVKKGQIGAANARQPPPIPPNKPLLNKANSTTTSNSRITFLQSQTVPGVSQAAQAVAAQNARETEE